MTGNGKHTTHKNGDDWMIWGMVYGILWHCFTHIISLWIGISIPIWKFLGENRLSPHLIAGGYVFLSSYFTMNEFMVSKIDLSPHGFAWCEPSWCFEVMDVQS